MSDTHPYEFTLDGFTLSGLDELGAEWTVETVRGWFTGGDVRADTQQRSQQSGDWRGPVYRAGRVVTLQGKVFTPSLAVLEQESRRLSALLAGGFGDLTGTVEGVTLSTSVQLEDAPLFDPLHDTGAVWQVTVGSESHLLYGAETFAQTTLAAAAGGDGLPFPMAFPIDFGVPPGVTPGAVTLSNDGTASYFPRLRIDGPVTNPVVTMVETGDEVRFNGTVAAGQHLDINWGVPRRVTLGDNPVSMRHKVTYIGNWLAVPVGGGSVTWSADAFGTGHNLSVWGNEGVWE